MCLHKQAFRPSAVCSLETTRVLNVGRRKSFHVCRFVFFIAVFRVWEVKLKLSREQFSEGFYVLCVMLLLHEYHVVRWIIHSMPLYWPWNWNENQIKADTATRMFLYCSAIRAQINLPDKQKFHFIMWADKGIVIQFSHFKREKSEQNGGERKKTF